MTTDKPSRNEDEYFAKLDAELLQSTRDLELGRIRAEERKKHFMKCPKDGADLTTRAEASVQVDVCPECGGMWLDAGELPELIRLSEQPGMLRRVVRDVMAALGQGRKADTE